MKHETLKHEYRILSKVNRYEVVLQNVREKMFVIPVKTGSTGCAVNNVVHVSSQLPHLSQVKLML